MNRHTRLFTLLFVLLLMAVSAVSVNAQGGCNNISPNACTTVPVSLVTDYCLNWDAGGHGGVANTGFTMVDPPSAPLTVPSIPAVPGLETGNTNIAGGMLTITSTKGIAFRDPSVSANTNSQVNAFGVGFNASTAPSYRLETTIVNPNFAGSAGNSSQQAGLWFGLNENNYIKMDVVKVNDTTGLVNMLVENYGANPTGPNPTQINSANLTGNINTLTIHLILDIDRLASNATGRYTVNGGAEQTLGPIAVPAAFFNGTTLPGVTGPVSYGGIFTTHRNAAVAASIPFQFNDFCLRDMTPNTPPVANNDVANTLQNTPVGFSVTANDTDSDGTIDANTVDLDPATGGQQTTRTVAGEGTYTVAGGTVTFTPDAAFSGTSTIQYTVNDDQGAASNQANITITVTANQPPVAGADAATTTFNTPVTFNITGNDTDPDGTIMIATVDLDPATGGQQTTRTVVGEGTFTYASGQVTFTPDAAFSGTSTIQYTIEDNQGGLSNQANIAVTVSVNPPPVAVNDASATQMDTPVSFGVLANDSDANGVVDVNTVDLDPATAGIQAARTIAGQGTFTVAAGTVTYTPATGFVGAASIQYTVNDNNGATSNAATITVTVTTTPPAPGTGGTTGQQQTVSQDQGQSPNIGVFDPAISKLGFLVPGQLGLTGEKLEWIVTVSNNGAVSGFNVVISDTLRPELRIDEVKTPSGAVNINGQTVTLTFAEVKPGEVIQFSIFTTVLEGGAVVDNTACVNADGMSAEKCATALPITSLPRTGETPWWRTALLSLLLIGGLALTLTGGISRRRWQPTSFDM